MQNWKRSTWSIALASVTALSAYAQDSQITVVLNGRPVAFENAQPKEMNGRVLIPVRGVLEQLGAQVGWDEQSQKVMATKGNLDVQLQIGQRTALVNGESMNLDVPAQNYNGSTMVPLRFMGEALGANVDWDASTRTVQITTPQASTEPAVPSYSINNMRKPVAAISTFNTNQSGLVKSNGAVRFTMNGTPGGQATFDIPGVADSIPMRETAPGVYVGEWRIPKGQGAMAMNDITAVGHLSLDGSDAIAETTKTFSIDTQPPRIYAMRPSDDGVLGNDRPTIGARLGDGAGSGIDSETTRLTIDGKDRTGDATISDAQISFQPDRPLAPGKHDVAIVTRDRAGNESTQSWSFRIADRPARPRRLSFGDMPSYGPGSHIAFAVDADPSSTVTLYMGEHQGDVSMQETRPGHYETSYLVRPDDELANRQIRAKVRTADGQEYWIDADRMLPGPRGLTQPTINGLHENDQVDSPLVLQGTATPYSDIEVHVSSSALLMLNQVRIHGVVGDYSVTTDEHGHWQTPPINLDKARGANKAFAITVYAMDSNGKKSAVTTLNVTE
jgi:copper amine oxidase-like protein/Big-like domain-containing protein